MKFDNAAAAQNECLLDDVFQFADIARKIVLHEAGHSFDGNTCNIFVLKAVEFGNDMVR